MTSPAALSDSRANLTPSGRGPEHIERRWRSIQKVINHDLPNQLIAIQGLLQLLELDESARLSPDGREIVRRLQGTSARVIEMAHLLKMLAKAGDTFEKPGAIVLAELVEEAAVEAKQRFPGLIVEPSLTPDSDQVLAGPRTLLHALVVLLKLAAQAAAGDKPRVLVGAIASAGGCDLWIGLGKQDDSQESATIWSARALDDRLEVLLARELVQACNGELRVADEPARGRLFTIRLPSNPGTP